MNTFAPAECGHVVQLIMPHDQNGAAHNSDVVSMKNYQHATFIVQIGAASRAAGVIKVESCSALGGGGTNTAIPFAAYKCETAYGSANDDVLGAKVAVAAATGIIPPAGTTGVFYVIELDSTEVLAGHVGFRLAIADPAAGSIGGAVAILSGSRFASPQTVTAVD